VAWSPAVPPVNAPAPQPEPLLWSAAQAAKRLGISRAYLYELWAAGEINSLKLGRRRLFPDAECRRFIEARLAESAEW
jgi:excisionase family DNA binding protein